MSNVGVQRKRQQNSLAEAGEIPAAEGSPFKCFDGVITAFSKPVGKMDVKGVEDGIAPVAQHPSTGLEHKKAEPVAGVEPEIGPAVGFSSVRSGHEVVEGFLQRTALRQPVGEAQYDVKGGLVLVGQSAPVREQQSVGALEVAALISGQLLLRTFSMACLGWQFPLQKHIALLPESQKAK